ncbi:hypothetical protein CgunFtcFv8_012021 [Champsocephalus gunnari]|uniref:Uncharacterized protein n=1 Tax=Champsocephalus gunnari TaxID=52237 RepID=A0AAN8DAC9_CHAGU|nr:hypothetical protein CgunFtcFv8_012021 [Champsocephalus gunnari]
MVSFILKGKEHIAYQTTTLVYRWRHRVRQLLPTVGFLKGPVEPLSAADQSENEYGHVSTITTERRFNSEPGGGWMGWTAKVAPCLQCQNLPAQST